MHVEHGQKTLEESLMWRANQALLGRFSNGQRAGIGIARSDAAIHRF
jgi:hypothetical protein